MQSDDDRVCQEPNVCISDEDESTSEHPLGTKKGVNLEGVAEPGSTWPFQAESDEKTSETSDRRCRERM